MVTRRRIHVRIRKVASFSPPLLLHPLLHLNLLLLTLSSALSFVPLLLLLILERALTGREEAPGGPLGGPRWPQDDAKRYPGRWGAQRSRSRDFVVFMVSSPQNEHFPIARGALFGSEGGSLEPPWG
eukprot:6019170-Pyramimonas_sp.AAC.1